MIELDRSRNSGLIRLALPAFAAFLLPLAGFHARAAETLKTRYAKLSCAVVQLQAPNPSGPGGEIGTGFFIDPEGHVVTAAHVAYDRTIIKDGDSFKLKIAMKPGLILIQAGNKRTILAEPKIIPNDTGNALHDLAILSTGVRPPCFLPTALKPDSPEIGDHFIAIGFPGGVKEPVLYDGFLSSKHTTRHTIGTVEGTGESKSNEFSIMRVQMPITQGASGSPLIGDDNHVYGVVIEIPVMIADDVRSMVAAFPSNAQVSGPIRIGPFDVLAVLGHLADAVIGYETPGSGYVVPISNLH